MIGMPVAEAVKKGVDIAQMQWRTLELARAEGDEIPCVISTDAPVDRGDYLEILEHNQGAVDLTRAPLPLIDSHDTGELPLGVVDRLVITGGKLRGYVKFSTSPRAQQLLADVKAGILRSLSIGYQILKHHLSGNRLIVTRWQPYECSCVSAPADPGAGFFRSLESPVEDVIEERARATSILATARMYDAEPLAYAGVSSGESISQFRQRVLLKAGRQPAALGMSKREVERYSLAGVLRALQTGNPLHADYEHEVHKELAKKHGEPATVNTMLVPPDVFREAARRDLQVAVGAQGGYLVDTANDAGFVELARPRSVALTLGATVLDNLRSSLTIPRVTVGAVVTWLANEVATATESTPTLGQIAFTPKSAAAYVEFSRQLLLQSNPSVNVLLARDLLAAVGTAVDIAVLAGTGASGQPTGILNTAGIGTFTGTSLNRAALVDAQLDVSGANASGSSCAYATTPAVAATLAQRADTIFTTQPVWLGNIDDGVIVGRPAMSSTAMPAATALYGNWPEVLVGNWGVLELSVNPYTNFPAAILGARAVISIDVGLRKPVAFTAATTIT